MEENQQWYHCILTTYGAWLWGDSRGFRTRHHREHIEGDYKNPPPPGAYWEREQYSRRVLKQDEVVLDPGWRERVGMALIDKLRRKGAFVLCISVSAQHIHILARMPFGVARDLLGIAKKHTWFVLRDYGWTGKLWGKRSKALPVKDREHQLNVYRYILAHINEGAWIWDFMKIRDLGEGI